MNVKSYGSMRHLLACFCMFVGIGGILSSESLSSCSSSVKNSVLLCADSIMESRPDSALLLLEYIPSPSKMPRSDRALYALLLTQARYKNYIPLDNDSLIRTAVDYYGSSTKSVRAAKAHYYLGATYLERGYNSFAVDEYLAAIGLMPVKDDFLAMMYDNLAEVYDKEGLYDAAMEAYRASYQIVKGKSKRVYPLRGIAHAFLMQNKNDSAEHYFQRALYCAVAEQDSRMQGALYQDLAMLYNVEKDYVRANEYASRAIEVRGTDAVNLLLVKAQILLNLNELDSAAYYYGMHIDQHDIIERAIYYDGMYRIAKAKGDWQGATQKQDTYMVLYDSIQAMNDNEKIGRLMDKHQLEEHKRMLSERSEAITFNLGVAFVCLAVLLVFGILWRERGRQKRYIDLQQELTQNRIEAMLLKDEEEFGADKESIEQKRWDLTEQQVQLCISVLKTTDCYSYLEKLEKGTLKEVMEVRSLKKEIRSTISKAFVDVMLNLQERYSDLTSDDAYFCVLSLLCCSKTTMMELLDTTPGALKSRKSRIKSKVDAKIFDYMFIADIQ